MTKAKITTSPQVVDLYPPNQTTKETKSLHYHVEEAITQYFKQLDGQRITNLYDIVISEVEEPLLKKVMTHTDGNQSQAATILGLSRGTLRKKLELYGML